MPPSQSHATSRADGPDEAFAPYDDLRIFNRALNDNEALTLTSVVRNEMYYLPAFFDHYRAMGIERFVIIDDQSDDGTTEFLADQPDCMVLTSERSFNERVPIDPCVMKTPRAARIRNIWANLLIRRYGMDRWSVHADADEFLRIPDGMQLRNFLQIVAGREGNIIYSLMVDLYPRNIKTLHAQADDPTLDLSKPWYFDALKHSRFRSNGRLKFVYGGSRARLMDEHGIRKLRSFKLRYARVKLGNYNLLEKPALIKMRPNGFLYNTHRGNMDGIRELLLPLEHFKFSGQLITRTQNAIQRRSHYDNSTEYVDMDRLLKTMMKSDASFLCKHSSPDRSFGNYQRAGIAQGFD